MGTKGSGEAWRAMPPPKPHSGLWAAWVSVRRQAQLPTPCPHNPSLCPAGPAWPTLHRPKGPWKPEQLEPHQVFFQAGPGALRRQRMQRERCSFIRLFIHSFLGQIIFIRRPLCGRHRTRCRGFSGGPSPGPDPHPSYFPDANRCQQNPSFPVWGLGLEYGAGEAVWGSGWERGGGYPLDLHTPDLCPSEEAEVGGGGGSLRAPPTRCCWSPGPRTSPSSRRSPDPRARSGQSGRRAHSR